MSLCGQYSRASRSSQFPAGFSCWAEGTVTYFLGCVEPGKILSKAEKGSKLGLGEESDTCVRLCAREQSRQSWEHFVSCKNKQY